MIFTRRSFLLLPVRATLLGLLFSVVRPLLAAASKTWTINVRAYRDNITTLLDLLKDRAVPGGELSASVIPTLFPLNPKSPQTLQQISDRTPIRFDAVTAESTADHARTHDFVDASLGRISLFLPEKIAANYTRTDTELTFEFTGETPDVIIWKMPAEFNLPKRLSVKQCKIAAELTTLTLSNPLAEQTLVLRLDSSLPNRAENTPARGKGLHAVQKGSGRPFATSRWSGVLVPAAYRPAHSSPADEPMSLWAAGSYLVAQSQFCCSGNCVDDQGNGGGENSGVFKRYFVVHRLQAVPGLDDCLVMSNTEFAEANQDVPKFGRVCGDFTTQEKAMIFLRDVLHGKCDGKDCP